MVQEVTPQGLLCPICRVDLVMTDRQGIEIDYCPKCRGVWLDRGELDKIIERSIGEVAPRASQGNYPSTSQGKHRAGHDDRRSGGHHGRRKGFLRELFD
ncbi:zf-TFIIB domain-containing protein [Novosphingobium profundi]|uniref:TFIIB-type zinc ribbon-containing protein n=1 Tax=Novosphingobium TaxID=165696 RepID=UPI00057DC8C9|nr:MULTISPECIES: zf-TFIIB domain-containing protein [Novosphingobium]MBT0671627.1 zf-TFIIB domain-containing protein [Novosphingobium profundi]